MSRLQPLLFLYKDVLGKALGHIADIVRAKRPKRLPPEFSRDEVKHVLATWKST
jgi:hypothetical protein